MDNTERQQEDNRVVEVYESAINLFQLIIFGIYIGLINITLYKASVTLDRYMKATLIFLGLSVILLNLAIF